ncbi:MAG: hypothetical protein QMC80_09000 [Thermoplasmatales archaeon]|nr:hypothetical protein [Thermoplasmatales archaeon]
MVLLHGRHEFDKEAEDGYLAFGNINNKNIRVVYEFILTQTGEHVLVVTAFFTEFAKQIPKMLGKPVGFSVACGLKEVM